MTAIRFLNARHKKPLGKNCHGSSVYDNVIMIRWLSELGTMPLIVVVVVVIVVVVLFYTDRVDTLTHLLSSSVTCQPTPILKRFVFLTIILGFMNVIGS